MEYQNIIIFVLIFIVLMTVFYFIISNFGISESETSSNLKNLNELEKKVLSLNNELTNMKINQLVNSNQITPIPSESNTIKEIIIETENPVINSNSNNDRLNSNLILPSQSNQTKPPPVIFDPIANYDQAKLLDPLVDPRGRTSADQIPAPQVAAQFNFPTQGVLDRYHRVGLLIAIDTPYDNEGGRGKRPRRRHSKKRVDRYPGDASSDNLSDNSSNSTNSSTGSNKSGNYRGVEFSGGGNGTFESFGNYMDEGPNGILELIGKKITDNWYKYFTSISKGNKIIKIVVNNRNRRELYSGDEVYIPELNRWYQVQMDEMDMIEYNPYMF